MVFLRLYRLETYADALQVQVEVFFSNLLAQILENEGPSFEMREVAMEHLVQFVSQPDFITDIYVNYDCHLHCTDLFVNLTKFLCKVSLCLSLSLSLSLAPLLHL